MTDSFDVWINDMDDDEYIDRLESSRDNGGFSDAQKRIALNIREAPDETELRDLEREQESGIERVKDKQVYDTRELPETPRYISTSSGDTAIVIDEQKSKAEFNREIQKMEIQRTFERAQEIQKRSIVQRIKDAFSFLRRKR
jgi:hypothetical protein